MGKPSFGRQVDTKTRNNTNHSDKRTHLESTDWIDTLNLALPRAKLLAKCLVRMNEQVSSRLSQHEVMILAYLLDDALTEAMGALAEMNGGRRDDA
jgi:hypothetical protein